MKFKYSLLLLFVLSLNAICHAQEANNANNPLLKGLHKARFDELDASQPLMLDGITIPVYSEKLKRLEGDDFMKVMMTADYIPEPYIDSTKSVKLFYFAKQPKQRKIR